MSKKNAIEVPSSLWMRCRQIVIEHGSTRKAADATGIDHAYLHRLANGECENPSDEVLAKLGLRKIVDIRYESVDAHGSFYDAYAGAREDMAIWKKRALLAEAQLGAEVDLRNATPTPLVVVGRKLTKHEIDRCASFAIETDILPQESWGDAGLYDFAHALNGGIGVVDDLAALVGRLAHALKNVKRDHSLAGAALDYLKRHGLEGSPLRATAAPKESLAVQQGADGESWTDDEIGRYVCEIVSSVGGDDKVGKSVREFFARNCRIIVPDQGGSADAVAIVDAGDDGYYAEILPDRDVKVGQLLYTRPAVDQADGGKS